LFTFFTYIREYYRKSFNPFYFSAVLLVLGVLVWLNYGYALESRYAAGQTLLRSFTGYYFLYFIPFALAFFLQRLFYKNCPHFKQAWFWVILLLAPAFFSFRVNFNFHQSFISDSFSADEQKFWIYCSNWVVRVFVLLIPVCIIWLIKDRKQQPFYGNSPLPAVKPHLLLIAAMLPLIAVASTQNDFLEMYPRVKILEQLSLSSKSSRSLLYELCYGFDFISIEFFFRGFLILALWKICGEHCIVPAACFYCTIHFGKPMGEAISSFWGGMLLGIVSYNTKSIRGGLMVHLGIAWLMELGGWLGSLLKEY
jgi:hypothetical protein